MASWIFLTVCSVVFLLAGAFLALFVVYRLGYFSEHNTYTTFAEQKRILDEEKRQVVEQLNEAHEKQSREHEREKEDLREEVLKMISYRKYMADQRAWEEATREQKLQKDRLMNGVRAHTRREQEKTRQDRRDLEDECARVKSEYEKNVNDLINGHTQQLMEKERELAELLMVKTQDDLRKRELEQLLAELAAQEQPRQNSGMPGLKGALRTSKMAKRTNQFHTSKNLNMRQSEARRFRRMIEAKYSWKLDIMKRAFRREVEDELARRPNDRPAENEPKPRGDDNDDSHDEDNDGRNGGKIALLESGPVQDDSPVQETEIPSDGHQLKNDNPSTESEGLADDEHLTVENHPGKEAEQRRAEEIEPEQTDSDEGTSEKEENMTVPIQFRCESRQSCTSTRSETSTSRPQTPDSLSPEPKIDPQSSSTDRITDAMLANLFSSLHITPVAPSPEPTTVAPTTPYPDPVIATIFTVSLHNTASSPAIGSSQISENPPAIVQDGDIAMGFENEQAQEETVDMEVENEQATLSPDTTAIVTSQELLSTSMIGNIQLPTNVSIVAQDADVAMIDQNEQAAPDSDLSDLSDLSNLSDLYNLPDGQDMDKDGSIIPDDEMIDAPTVSSVDLDHYGLTTYLSSATAARPMTVPQSVYTPSVISPFSEPASNIEESIRQTVNRPLYTPSSTPAWTTVVHTPRPAGYPGAPYAGVPHYLAGSSLLRHTHPAASTSSPSALPSARHTSPWEGMREIAFQQSQSAIPSLRAAANMPNVTPVLSPFRIPTNLSPSVSPTNMDIMPRLQRTPSLGNEGPGTASRIQMTHVPSSALPGITPPARGPSASGSAHGVESDGGLPIPEMAVTALAQTSSALSAQSTVAAPLGSEDEAVEPPAVQAAPPTPSNPATGSLPGTTGRGNVRPRRPLTDAEQKEKDNRLVFGIKPKRKKPATQSGTPRAAQEGKNRSAAPEAAQEAENEASALEEAQIRELVQKLGTDSTPPKKPANLIVTDERHQMAIMYGTAVEPRSASSPRATPSKRGRSEDADESHSKRQRE